VISIWERLPAPYFQVHLSGNYLQLKLCCGFLIVLCKLEQYLVDADFSNNCNRAQVVGWPPIRSYRKNTMAMNQDCLYVKVSMDGAPYLRKVDLKMYSNYKELSLALEKMFSSFTVGDIESNGKSGREGLSDCRLMDHKNGTELVLTYKDKDGDWMLVGDVPWRMFTGSCRRLRIMKGSDAVGLAPRATEKSKNGN